MINQKTENAVNVLKYCSELCTDIDSIFEDIAKALEGKRKKQTRDFEEKTFDEIALEEGCTYQCVQRSVYRAVEKIKNILKKLIATFVI